MRAVAQLAVANRGALSRRHSRIQRQPCTEALRRPIEHLDQGFVPKRSAWPRARMQFELRENMPAQSRHMDVEPVVSPVDAVGMVRMRIGMAGYEPRVKIAYILPVESVSEILNIGP